MAGVAGTTGVAGYAGYEALKDDKDTGPASKTIGPHESNVANVLDPRVKPEPEKMRGEKETVGYVSEGVSLLLDLAGGGPASQPTQRLTQRYPLENLTEILTILLF